MLRVVEIPDEGVLTPEELFGSAAHWTIAEGRRWWEPADCELSASFALADGGQVVAMAGAFRPVLHHERLWAFVEVTQQARRRGLGSHAVAELRNRLPTGARLRCKVAPDSPAEVFARRHGLRPIQATKTVRVHLDAIGDSSGIGRFSIDAAPAEAVDAWRRYYTAGHAWDPPSEQPLTFWRGSMGAADDTVLTWPAEPPFRGLAIVGPGGAWTGGSVHRDDPDAVATAGRLLSAAASSSSTLEVELDDWMSEVDDALRGLRTVVVDQAHILAE